MPVESCWLCRLASRCTPGVPSLGKSFPFSSRRSPRSQWEQNGRTSIPERSILGKVASEHSELIHTIYTYIYYIYIYVYKSPNFSETFPHQKAQFQHKHHPSMMASCSVQWWNRAAGTKDHPTFLWRTFWHIESVREGYVICNLCNHRRLQESIY